MPRRASSIPPIYPRNAKPGQRTFARVWRGGTFKDFPLGPAGSEQAREAYQRLLTSLGCTKPGDDPLSEITVVAAVVKWLNEAERRYDPRGRELTQHKMSMRPLTALYGKTKAAAFDAKALEAVQRAMASGSWMNEAEQARAAARGLPIGWCRNVVNRRIVRIQTAWKWIEKEGLVPKGSHANLCTVTPLRKNDRTIRHTPKVKPAAWAQLMAAVRHAAPAVKVMLLLQYWAGMRSGEVRIMRTVDITGIDQAGAVWTYRPAAHKGDWREDEQPRVVPLGPKCQALLRRWLRLDDPEAFLFRPRRRVHDHYTLGNYAQAVRTAAAKAGLPPRTFRAYMARHAARDRIAQAAGAEAARCMLGHKSLRMTDEYGSLDTRHAAEAAKKLA